MKRKKGFALVMALVLMVIFFVVTIAFTTIIGYEFKTSKENQLTSKALYAADAGVHVGMSILRSIMKQVLDGTITTQIPDPLTGNLVTHSLMDIAGQYQRDTFIHQIVLGTFRNGLSEMGINVGDTYFGAYKITMESISIQKVIQNIPKYPIFNLYNLKLKAQGMVTNETEVVSAKSLRVEILVNTYRAKCQIYRWYDAQ